MHNDASMQQRQRRCNYFNGEQVAERAVPEQSKTVYTSENDLEIVAKETSHSCTTSFCWKLNLTLLLRHQYEGINWNLQSSYVAEISGSENVICYIRHVVACTRESFA
jgi:hypothetical protein